MSFTIEVTVTGPNGKIAWKIVLLIEIDEGCHDSETTYSEQFRLNQVNYPAKERYNPDSIYVIRFNVWNKRNVESHVCPSQRAVFV